VRLSNRQRIKFYWQDGWSIVQIALALKCSAREVEKELILTYAVPARRQSGNYGCPISAFQACGLFPSCTVSFDN
jgi:hypothetical protein